MTIRKLTKAELKLWETYTQGRCVPKIISTSVIDNKKIFSINDYINQKPIHEQSKIKKHSGKCYEAKIDLHGMTQNEAHDKLEKFLCRQKLRGAKCVLVITGKSRGKKGGIGVLKRVVPFWMDNLKIVRTYSTASSKDGGEGALYVYLK